MKFKDHVVPLYVHINEEKHEMVIRTVSAVFATKKKRPTDNVDTARAPNMKDKITGMMVSWQANKANINSIMKKPSHGIPSGKYGISLALRLCDLTNVLKVRLYDASTIRCKGTHGSDVDLRLYRLLKKGQGWYDSYGFAPDVRLIKTHLKNVQSMTIHEWLAYLHDVQKVLFRASVSAGTRVQHVRVGDNVHVKLLSKDDAEDLLHLIQEVLESITPEDQAETVKQFLERLDLGETCGTIGRLIESIEGMSLGLLVPDFNVQLMAPHANALAHVQYYIQHKHLQKQ